MNEVVADVIINKPGSRVNGDLCQVERERAGKRMLEKQSLIVENTLKAEEAKVRHYAANVF